MRFLDKLREFFGRFWPRKKLTLPDIIAARKASEVELKEPPFEKVAPLPPAMLDRMESWLARADEEYGVLAPQIANIFKPHLKAIRRLKYLEAAMAGDARVVEMMFNPGEAGCKVEHWATKLIAESFVQTLMSAEGTLPPGGDRPMDRHFIVLTFDHPEVGPVEVEVRKVHGHKSAAKKLDELSKVLVYALDELEGEWEKVQEFRRMARAALKGGKVGWEWDIDDEETLPHSCACVDSPGVDRPGGVLLGEPAVPLRREAAVPAGGHGDAGVADAEGSDPRGPAGD